MVVMSAEATIAMAKAVKNPNSPRVVLTPRDRTLSPNPTAAGGNIKKLAQMPYFINVLADPIALCLPKRIRSKSSSTDASSSKSVTSVDEDERYSEFSIMSTNPSDSKFSIVKFLPPNPEHKIHLDSEQFVQPIKMNRKNPKSKIYAEPDTVEPSIPLLGPDGEPVYLPSGEMVMVFADGQTTISRAKGKARASKSTDSPAKKKGFGKRKTRQVFRSTEENWARRKEEYLPWLIEDAGKQEWVGKLNDKNDPEIYGVMTIAEEGYFSFAPAHRFYDFIQKRQYSSSIRADDAEKTYAADGKIDRAAQFAVRNGGMVSPATRRTLAKVAKMETTFKPTGKLRAVDDDDLFGNGGSKAASDQDMDEVVYEDYMADDDEGDCHEEIAEDDDEKEAKERLRREYIAANKAGNDDVSEDDVDDAFEGMSYAERQELKDLLRSTGKEVDESDDEEDPYSKRYGSIQKENKGQDMLPLAREVREKRETVKLPAVAAVTPSTPKFKELNIESCLSNEYRHMASSTVPKSTPRANNHASSSGSSLIAMRAISESPTRAGANVSRAGSTTGRTRSLLAGGTSPPASSPASSGYAVIGNGKKRKNLSHADEPMPAKRITSAPDAASSPSTAAPTSIPIPTTADVIQFIKSKGGKVTTRVLSAHYKTKKSDTTMKALLAIVGQIGTIQGKTVVLNPGLG